MTGSKNIEIRTRLARPEHWIRYARYSVEMWVMDPSIRERVQMLSGEVPEIEFELPSELLPSILALDLDDEGAILAFVTAFGFMRTPEAQLRGESEDLLVIPRRVGRLDQDGWIRTPALDGGYHRHMTVGGESEPIEEFRLGAAALKAAHLVLQELDQGANFSLARVRSDWPDFAPWPAPARRTLAESHLQLVLNLGLSMLELLTDIDSASVTASPRFSLFGLMSLELIDSIQNRLPYRRCLNCNGWFHRQWGRGRKDAFSRADAKYCSNKCSRAKGERDRYRAKSAETKEVQSGTRPKKVR
jgi:hypothetical protein